ncbi:MAG: arylsulfatase [Chloroflexota bacterium]
MQQTNTKRPNVILILVDDMGFADLGIMGSEIRTPNLDRLANEGVLCTSMYNGARCCPSRASLLTGLYPHRAGVGHMTADLGEPAYQGRLADNAVTIAEVLQLSGYRTLMSGKWHVGGEYYARRTDEWRPGAEGFPTPRQRGFDRYYGIIDGVTNFFSPHYIMEDDVQVEVSSDDYYFTDAITDKAIDMVTQSVADDKPFFLYLAHTAPHWPLHAPAEDIARYEGIYDQGWDAVRTARHEEMNSRGLLQQPWDISPRDASAPPWADVPHKAWEAQRMAVYAAMIDRMDQSIGRLLDTLKQLGQDEDTLILFLSDNGGCAEFMAEDGWAKFMPDVTNDGRQITMGNRPDVLPGGPLTYMSYDLPWANVSNAPFRLFKHWVHEGGISTPLIAHWPARLENDQQKSHIQHTPCHLVDILPTILAATGASYPREYNNHEIPVPDGESLLPMLEGQSWMRQQPIFWEHEGNCAVRLDNFKLVRQYKQPWELYDMDMDRTELHNLIGRHEPLTQQLLGEFERWATDVGVIEWSVLLPRLYAYWGMNNIHG